MSKQPPKYQLTYFDIMGRGEVIRLCFAAAGIKFEDRRIGFKDWPEEKSKSPQGTLPYLTIDGKITVSQSTAIFRYLAREFSLYGKTSIEALYIDEVVDTAVDLCIQEVAVKNAPDETKKEELRLKLAEKTLPKYLDILEKLVEKSGKDGFAVGSKLSLADLELYLTVDFIGIEKELVKYPKLKANRAKTAANKKIADWLKIRPVTKF